MHTYKISEQGLPLEKASKAIIALHGRGGTAQDILGLAHLLGDEQCYYAAPQATNNSWYPQSFMAEESLNEPWLTSAVDTIKHLIEETARLIPKEKIYIIGFSQGACLALEVSARYAEKYGGIAAFTGAMITRKEKGNFEGTKIFIGTSDHDPHIPLVRVEQSVETLEGLGAQVTLKVYPGTSHTVTQAEINWVKQNLIV